MLRARTEGCAPRNLSSRSFAASLSRPVSIRSTTEVRASKFPQFRRPGCPGRGTRRPIVIAERLSDPVSGPVLSCILLPGHPRFGCIAPCRKMETVIVTYQDLLKKENNLE